MRNFFCSLMNNITKQAFNLIGDGGKIMVNSVFSASYNVCHKIILTNHLLICDDVSS